MDQWINDYTDRIIEFIDEPLHIQLPQGGELSLSDLEAWLALNATEILPEPEPEPEPTPAPTPTPKQETRYIMTKRYNRRFG